MEDGADVLRSALLTQAPYGDEGGLLDGEHDHSMSHLLTQQQPDQEYGAAGTAPTPHVGWHSSVATQQQQAAMSLEALEALAPPKVCAYVQQAAVVRGLQAKPASSTECHQGSKSEEVFRTPSVVVGAMRRNQMSLIRHPSCVLLTWCCRWRFCPPSANSWPRPGMWGGHPRTWQQISLRQVRFIGCSS
jgi:hypothetical protein